MKAIAFVASVFLTAVPLSLPVLAGNEDPLFIRKMGLKPCPEGRR
ncbi:hypothetical protein [Synechocystis sp. LEGE 06083]|nr:hypothetical protein [Synechocystis sp. LEGE 06083]